MQTERENKSMDDLVPPLIALAEANIPTDVQELLVQGDPMRGIPPGALTKAIAAALSSMEAGAVKGPPFEFDRYVNGRLMAEGVTIERETTLAEAMQKAATIASRGPHGEVPVLVLRQPSPASPVTDEMVEGKAKLIEHRDEIERLTPPFYIRWTSGPNYERAFLCVEDGEPDMNSFAEVSFGQARKFKAGIAATRCLAPSDNDVARFGWIDPASGHEPLYFGRTDNVEPYAISGPEYVLNSDHRAALEAALQAPAPSPDMGKAVEAAKKQIILAMQLRDFGSADEDGDFTCSAAQIDMLEECAEEAAKSALAAAAPFLAAPAVGWRTMDSAPKDGTNVLGAHEQAAIVVYWQEDHTVDGAPGWACGETDLDGYFYTYPVTHWMPLPPLPAAPEQGGENGE